jgi:hypothetical protein
MSAYRQTLSIPRGRHDFRWDSRFCVRQRLKYNVEDNKVLENPASTADLIDAFFDEHESILNPPCYNYVALKEFLVQADLQHLTTSRPALTLLDDRREDSGGDGSMRNWESDRYARQPLSGENVQRLVLDEGALFTKVRENVWRTIRKSFPMTYVVEEDNSGSYRSKAHQQCRTEASVRSSFQTWCCSDL